jgi:5-methylcytosine-specific restriction endonuclease McrA
VEKAVHRAVRIRADHRCEYCRFPEAWASLPFHLDHIIAQQHGGHTTFDNLALACCFCNRYKGPNVSAIDPDSGEIIPLFHPRQQSWDEHFAWHGARLFAQTPTGRATINLLQINRADAVAVRGLLMQAGVFGTEPFGTLTVHEPSYQMSSSAPPATGDR